MTDDSRGENKYIVDWYVSNVRIPPQLETQRDEVLKLLREGLDAMGFSTCRRVGVDAVNVHFK